MGLTSGRRITITKTLARRPPSAAPASVWSLSYRHVTDRLTAVLRAEPAPRYLKVLVDQIRRAAADLGVPVQSSPWLAPLPDALLLRDLPAPGGPPRPGGAPGAGHAPIPFGLIDLPGLQRQQPAAVDLDAFGHLMAAGAPRSGRSQLLRTLAAAAAASHTCADLHLYGLDGGNGASWVCVGAGRRPSARRPCLACARVARLGAGIIPAG